MRVVDNGFAAAVGAVEAGFGAADEEETGFAAADEDIAL